MTGSDRAGAYADLLAAVLATRSDPTTARFDAEIAAAEASGALDGATARNLRWWQRESVRALGEHVTAVLPGLLASLLDAERAAEQTVADSEASWAAATGGRPRDDRGPDDGGDDDGDGGGGGAGPRGPDVAPGGLGREAVGSSRGQQPTQPGSPTALRAVSAPGVDVTRATPPASTGAPRQRLLVGGLTVLSEGARPGAAPSTPTL